MTFTVPSFRAAAFTCPHCQAFAHVVWTQTGYLNRHENTPAWWAQCAHCKKFSLWLADNSNHGCMVGRMLVPAESNAPAAHSDMPEDVARDYEEARVVSQISPRAACALLRVAIERLCRSLNAKGNTINDQIADLVQQGLPVLVQQSLDAVRVIGNNAVHPGTMDPEDVAEVTTSLFALVNIIIEDRITRPKMVAAVFESLPESTRKAIEQRDGSLSA
jgi:Domain of unknown function (DUF4145)